MLRKLGLLLSRRARTVLVLAGIVVIAAGALGFGAFGKLKGGGFEDPGAESSKSTAMIDREFGGKTDLVLLVRPERGTVDSPAASAAGKKITKEIVGRSTTQDVISYWKQPSPALKSEDDRAGLVLVRIKGDAEAVSDAASSLIEDYVDGDKAGRSVSVKSGGSAAVNHEISGQVTMDLAIAEAIAVPITLLLLILVFRGLVPALIPLAIGMVAILGTFAELFVLGSLTDVSIFAINLTTALGLGLSIDYGLLMVSRFREQIAAGEDIPEAIATTVATAGRSVLYSAAAVAAALTAPLIFPLYFLRSFAYAGIGVVLISALTALLLTPAMLQVLGRRVARKAFAERAAREAGGGAAGGAKTPAPEARMPFWGRLASYVMQHPLRTALPAVAVLLVVMTPLLGARFGTPDERVLPESKNSRQVAKALNEDFPGGSVTEAVQVVADGAEVGPAETSGFARRLAALPHVKGVDTALGTFLKGTEQPSGRHDPARTAEGRQHLTVRMTVGPTSEDAEKLVKSIRALPGPNGSETLVGGRTAQTLDTQSAIGDRLPWAVLLIVATTFILLFLFTGSVLQPLRALMLNALGLTAIIGAMVWIFQDGHLQGLFGFTAMPMDISMTLLMFVIVFGLSMDYEVFVMSRVKELHDAGLPNREAVAQGLARTGSIVSAAAALLAVSLLAFTTSKVSFMQMFGLASGLAILLDATVLRGVLVPAVLRVLGERGWWAPGPLRRLHERIGLKEAEAEAPGREG